MNHVKGSSNEGSPTPSKVERISIDLTAEINQRVKDTLSQIFDDNINHDESKDMTNLREQVLGFLEKRMTRSKPSSCVSLNVGGVIYTTSVSTLSKYEDSMLGVLFSGKYSPEKDRDGNYFIDRDGHLFAYILKFLRTNNLSIDPNETLLLSDILVEANYYQIKPLSDMINSLMSSEKRTKKKYKLKEKKPEYSRLDIHKMKVQHMLYHSRLKLNLVGLNLAGIDFSGLDLTDCDFSRCNLMDVSFENCKLLRTVFTQAYLRNANFQQSILGSIVIEEAADFTDAYLQGCDFTRYYGAIFRVNFEGADISNCIGLDENWLK